MGFAGSDAGVLTIEGLGYFPPDMLTFYGRDEDGMKTQLIQHVSQLSVMLRAVPKAEPEEPARRIGFRLATGWQGGEAGDASA
jgi:GH25 family lysozyme M1 (1,4-beta-N-acetylmuramidase)